jgi:hypothetical protein
MSVGALQEALSQFNQLAADGRLPPIDQHFPSIVLDVITTLDPELKPFIDDSTYLSYLHCAAVLYFQVEIRK